MELLKEALIVLHEIDSECSLEFQEYCGENLDLYESMPHFSDTVLFSCEQKCFGATDYEEYEDLELKEGIDEIQALRDLAYEIYMAMWFLKRNHDILIKAFTKTMAPFYENAVYFASSEDLDDLKNRIERIKANEAATIIHQKAEEILEKEIPYEGLVLRSLFERSAFFQHLEKISEKYRAESEKDEEEDLEDMCCIPKEIRDEIREGADFMWEIIKAERQMEAMGEI